MKAMQELKGLTNPELEAKLAEYRKEHFALRAKKSTGSLEKPASLKLLKKQIARVLTLLNKGSHNNLKKSHKTKNTIKNTTNNTKNNTKNNSNKGDKKHGGN